MSTKIVETYKNSKLINQPQNNKKVFEQDEVTLTCEADIDSSLVQQGVVWSWLRNSDVVNEESVNEIVTNYVIENVSKEDSAFYQCKLKTTLEEIVGSQSSLRVYSITKISKHRENV